VSLKQEVAGVVHVDLEVFQGAVVAQYLVEVEALIPPAPQQQAQPGRMFLRRDANASDAFGSARQSPPVRGWRHPGR
jgi:hypothetical protein